MREPAPHRRVTPRHMPLVARWLRMPVCLALLAQVWVTTPAWGQRPDSTVATTQRLVNAGERARARAFADSVLGSTRDGTPAYAAALYARAFASSSAVEAERDYLRVMVEYPLSAHAEDATMMVAQLRLARSDRSGARRTFERLVRDHPDGSQSGKAAFWAGRLALEDGDIPRGCQSLEFARRRVSLDDVELGNQVDYFLQRCPPAAAAASAAPASAAAPSVAAAPASMATADSARNRVPAPVAARERTREPTLVPDSAPPPGRPGREYSVQVAAFPKQRDATALAEVLAQRGYEARVWGAKAPYRVRVGRFATRDEAEAMRARMQRARVNGMVVDAEPR